MRDEIEMEIQKIVIQLLKDNKQINKDMKNYNN